MIEELLAEGERRMSRAIDDLKKDLNTVRTGRANPSILDNVVVEYYGTQTPLNGLAQISVGDPRQIVIQPYDRSSMAAIEKAIQKSDLGLTPNNDGTAIRLNIPPLTEQRRKDLVKQVHKMVEDHKVAVRNGRRDVHDKLKAMEKDKSASADEIKRAQDRLQKITDRIIGELDAAGRHKEEEIMTV
ncbi:MAG TPA: ribosome recycling factor [Chloroflexota bacterium]|nr:ribosome recycling factor [Chloroflexota bacterium]